MIIYFNRNTKNNSGNNNSGKNNTSQKKLNSELSSNLGKDDKLTQLLRTNTGWQHAEGAEVTKIKYNGWGFRLDGWGSVLQTDLVLSSCMLLSTLGIRTQKPILRGSKGVGFLASMATKLFACLGVLNCAFNIYFDLMVKILEIFGHMLTHLSYMINKESRKSIGNFLRYNYFLPQVSFEQFGCWCIQSKEWYIMSICYGCLWLLIQSQPF